MFDSAKAYYGRVFMEHFLAASGQEPLGMSSETCIDPKLGDRIVEVANRAGIEFRKDWLGI
jgi:hypothetical protein